MANDRKEIRGKKKQFVCEIQVQRPRCQTLDPLLGAVGKFWNLLEVGLSGRF